MLKSKKFGTDFQYLWEEEYMDNLTPEQRRKNMQAIKSNDTKSECILRKKLWSMGYRYRKNYKKLIDKLDIVFVKYKIAVLCDGEFWLGKYNVSCMNGIFQPCIINGHNLPLTYQFCIVVSIATT